MGTSFSFQTRNIINGLYHLTTVLSVTTTCQCPLRLTDETNTAFRYFSVLINSKKLTTYRKLDVIADHRSQSNSLRKVLPINDILSNTNQDLSGNLIKHLVFPMRIDFGQASRNTIMSSHKYCVEG
ncbi:hypothetical protein DPMN_012523 [Dreissena polymorpha]|uniref:Uncharacterized protein n=1 Tax=Dreissena polymorpha TaxID=45954 RepID=A0A9D4N2J9_DREPO|nr:hypothetical protein DPMN_012523 [Dreissena polymorpha]